MIVIAGIIVVPLVVALLLLVLRNNTVRNVLVVAAVLVMAVLALLLCAQYLFAPTYFILDDAELLNHAALIVGLAISLYVIVKAVRAGQFFVVLLAGIQCVLVAIYDLGFAEHGAVVSDLYVDQLSIIMALIIAIIGGAICIYALGYMRMYQEHKEHEGTTLATSGDPSAKAQALALVRDRRHTFFAVFFAFLSAMFLLVFANRLSWFFTAWEVTTVCSFVLIGFSRTPEATRNSFKAVTINLMGGLALCTALILVANAQQGVFDLTTLVAVATEGTITLPVMLIAFAGMTKAAQVPFQGWLLGAMVAPTPVSALLHSSTMVKAGVFILIKLAPAFGWNIPGLFVITVGALSFLVCSALAISQANSKRVLAYSTVANLGLILCCVGVGTPEATWAAIFLLIFHAAAKALLFCCVGTAEHHMGSRDIERMDNIFIRMPWLATFMALGMLAMFIAPFGMLISKWAALVSVAQSGHVELLFILAFGSALTFMFWAKWLGKVLAVGNTNDKPLFGVSLSEKGSLSFMALLLLAITLALPYISELFVVPYLQVTGTLLELPLWMALPQSLSYENLIIMNIVLCILLVMLVIQILRKKPPANDTVYMAGVGIDSDKRSFKNSFEQSVDSTQRNWYLDQVFGEATLGKVASIATTVLIALFFVASFAGEMIVL